MKSIGRWILLVCSFAAFPHLLLGQAERKTMTVKLTGLAFREVYFSLSDQPQYWVTNNTLYIRSAAKSAHYSLSNVDEILFSNEETNVEDNASSAQVSLYPNPTQDYIQVANLPGDAQVELLDASGAKLEQFVVAGQKAFSILVENLPNGVYFLKINHQSYKFIKK